MIGSLNLPTRICYLTHACPWTQQAETINLHEASLPACECLDLLMSVHVCQCLNTICPDVNIFKTDCITSAALSVQDSTSHDGAICVNFWLYWAPACLHVCLLLSWFKTLSVIHHDFACIQSNCTIMASVVHQHVVLDNVDSDSVTVSCAQA